MQMTAVTSMYRHLEAEQPIDWSNLEEAASRSRSILEMLASDRAALSALTLQARRDAALFGMCECHTLDDKIVIYDGLERQNFRIRWRLAKSDQYERVHSHRFSFTTRILRGTHSETLYFCNSPSDGEVSLGDFEAAIEKELVCGQTFTIHHSTFHSTVTSEDAVALLMRGPAEKVKAPIIRKDSAEMWFRFGAADESEERRRDVAMSVGTFDCWIDRLRAGEFID